MSERGWGNALRYALVVSLFFAVLPVAEGYVWKILYGDLESAEFVEYCASGCNFSVAGGDPSDNNADSLWGNSSANQYILRKTASAERAYAHFAIPLSTTRPRIVPEALHLEIKAWSYADTGNAQTIEFSPDNETWYKFDYNATAGWRNVLTNSNMSATLEIMDFINRTSFLNIYFTVNTTASSDGVSLSGINLTAEVYNNSESILTNCTNPDHEGSFQFDMYDEADPFGRVNGTIDAMQFDWILENGTERSMALIYDYNISHFVCVQPTKKNFTADMHTQYVAVNYSARNWYFNDVIVDNVTDVVNLYLINDTQDDLIAIHIRDESLNDKEGAEVRVLRWMPPAYTTSTILQTNAEGKAYVYLDKDEWYKFQVLDNSTLYKTTEATQLVEYSTSTPYVIDVPFGDPVPYLTWIGGVGYTITASSNGGILYKLEATDPSGLTSAGFVNLSSINTTAPVVYCKDKEGSGTSFTVTCAPANEPEGLYLAQAYFYMADGGIWLVDSRVMQYGEPVSEIPNDGVILSVILVGTVAFAGLVHPVLAVFMTIIGLAAVAALQLTLISWESIIGILAVGLIVMYIIGRGGQEK